MAVTNVACPHCGREALVTVPTYRTSDGTIETQLVKRVVQNEQYKEAFKTTIHAACPHCKESFGVLFA